MVRSSSALFESFGQGKRGETPSGPRHCHRGRPGQQTTGRVGSKGRTSGKEPVGGGSGSQETCRTKRFSVGEPERARPRILAGAGSFRTARDFRLVEREVRMTTGVLLALLGFCCRLLPHTPSLVAFARRLRRRAVTRSAA